MKEEKDEGRKRMSTKNREKGWIGCEGIGIAERRGCKGGIGKK